MYLIINVYTYSINCCPFFPRNKSAEIAIFLKIVCRIVIDQNMALIQNNVIYFFSGTVRW